jgi:DNA-binding transcriptional regulator YiaG
VTKDELKKLRARLGLTQQQLAKKLNVDVATISRWERGARGIGNPEEILLRAIENESKENGSKKS